MLDSSLNPALSQHHLQPEPEPDGRLRAALGSALLHWVEPRSTHTTVNGSSQATAMTALAGAAYTAVGGTPTGYNATGGPLNRPYLSLTNGGNSALRAAVLLGAGSQMGVYFVARFDPAATSTGQYPCLLSTQADISQPRPVSLSRSGTAFGMGVALSPTSGSVSGTVATPSTWIALCTRYTPSGWQGSMSAGPTGVATSIVGKTGTLANLDYAWVGHSLNASGGDWACTIVVNMSASADDRHLAVRDYLSKRFNLALSA